MESTKFAQRLKQARAKKNLKQEELAIAMGVSRSTIQNYEKGNTRPKAHVVRAFAEILGCDMAWLLGLEETVASFQEIAVDLKRELIGPLSGKIQEIMPPIAKTPSECNYLGNHWLSPDDDEECVSVPIVEARLSAGGGGLIDSSREIDTMVFKRSWIQSKGKPKDLVLMHVQGDSMEPAIYDKDLILIDISKEEVKDGKVFAVAFDGAIFIKRIFRQPGKLILKSENAIYSDIVIDLYNEADIETVKIIGKAIWWCHEELS